MGSIQRQTLPPRLTSPSFLPIQMYWRLIEKIHGSSGKLPVELRFGFRSARRRALYRPLLFKSPVVDAYKGLACKSISNPKHEMLPGISPSLLRSQTLPPSVQAPSKPHRKTGRKDSL